MALIRWLGEEGGQTQYEKMQQELSRLVSAFGPWAGAGRGVAPRGSVYPALNLYEDGEQYVVRAEVPGVDSKDLELTVTGDTLTLHGERKGPEVPAEASFHRRELGYGKFRRSISLPGPVDSSKVIASCTDGILEIRLPRAEESKQRKIEIKAS